MLCLLSLLPMLCLMALLPRLPMLSLLPLTWVGLLVGGEESSHLLHHDSTLTLSLEEMRPELVNSRPQHHILGGPALSNVADGSLDLSPQLREP